MKRAQYVKRSICGCGFPVLDEAVPLGQWYIVNEKDRDVFTFTCGGCGTTKRVDGIWVAARSIPGPPVEHCGYLPECIFGPLKNL